MLITIVVGTGRCGSTMLSRMLHMHPEVLSISELWNNFRDEGVGISTHDMEGEEFWQRIAKPDPNSDGLVLADMMYPEYMYPVARGRFNPATGVPSICSTLASISDDPDALYDGLAEKVSAWSRRPMAEHCRAFFAELAGMLGRPVVVERTGGSLSLLPVLRQQFPEARYVFLHRDGPDCVLSMQRHPVARLVAMKIAAACAGNLEWSTVPLPAEMKTASPADFEGLSGPPFDRERFLAYPLPLSFLAWLWSEQTREGTGIVREIPRDAWMPLRYERVLTDTRAELTRLAEFIGIPASQQWLEAASAFADAGRSGASTAQLQPGVLAGLRAACAAGTMAFDLLEAEHAA